MQLHSTIPVNLTAKQRKVWAKTDGHCWYCGSQLVVPRIVFGKQPQHNWFTLDHIHPRHHGGSGDISNLLPACRSCNSAKGKKGLEEYRTHIERKMAGAPGFTAEQLAYLEGAGFEFPGKPNHVFWGEQQGIPSYTATEDDDLLPDGVDSRPLRRRVLREQEYFTMDEIILDEYGKVLGPHGIAVYACLARLAGQDRSCQPGYATIATYTGMSKRQVLREIAKLADLGLILITPRRNPRTKEHNTNLYTLTGWQSEGNDT